MTIAYWCVLVAAMLPYFAVVGAKASPGFDNRAPRPWLERLSGWRQRAFWAHQNGFEAFPPFAAAVIIAHLAGAPQQSIDMLALGFVLARGTYSVCYIMDWPAWRSLSWAAGMLCVLGLFATSV